MLELGMSTASFYPRLTEEAARDIVKLGYKKAEVFLNSECEFDKNYIIELKKILDDGEVEVVSVHPYTSAIESIYFFTPYPRRAQDALASYRKYFEMSKILGAKYFTLHGDRNFDGDMSSIDLSLHVDVLARMAEIAREYDILITQENVSWCISQNPEYLRAIKNELGDKIGFTLDIKQAKRAKINLYDYIDAMGDKLFNVHISDNNSENSCLLPGHGNVDYAKFFEKLIEIGYDGALILEIYSSAFDDIRQIEASKHYLCDVIDKIQPNS